MRKSALIAILLLFSTGYARAQIPTTEREALIALYTSTNGPAWTVRTNWLGPVGTECTWHEVYCEGGVVSGLELENNNLSGTIPPELGNLSSLKFLRLEDNKITGSIPPELGNLSILQSLWLDTNQLSGAIPPELGNLANVTHIDLSSNQLTGSIPPDLGDLPKLQYLWLNSNQLEGGIPQAIGNLTWPFWSLNFGDNSLSGSIPPEMGSMTYLRNCFLFSNKLSGSIPPEIGTISTLEILNLSDNRLDGPIPLELGALSNLKYLKVNSNMLAGEAPQELADLSSLMDGDGLDMRWNALHSDNVALSAFLDQKHIGPNWLSTQTLPPENLVVSSIGDHTVWLNWDAVSYLVEPGGYQVFASPTGSESWDSRGWVEPKTVTSFPVAGLDSGTAYDLSVASFTHPHVENQNLVESDLSTAVLATTTDTGCEQPIIEVSGHGPFTLSLVDAHDSYLWSTGETASSIVVDPPHEQWYWVRVTDSGSCDEAASKLVYPEEPVFFDGFESGDFSVWSLSVPAPCTHDPCQVGAALDPLCDACVGQICAVDSFCCATYWDRACVDQVPSVCGLTCD